MSRLQLLKIVTLSKYTLAVEVLYVKGLFEIISAVDEILMPAKMRQLIFVGGSRIGGMRITRGAATWPEVFGLVRTAEFIVKNPDSIKDLSHSLNEIKTLAKEEEIDQEVCRWLLHNHQQKSKEVT